MSYDAEQYRLKRASEAEQSDQEMQALRDGAGCPRCGAAPGLLCRNVLADEEMEPVHAERREAGRRAR